MRTNKKRRSAPRAWLESEMDRIAKTLEPEGSGDRVLDTAFGSQQSVDGILRMLLAFQILDMRAGGEASDLKFMRASEWVLRLWYVHRQTLSTK